MSHQDCLSTPRRVFEGGEIAPAARRGPSRSEFDELTQDTHQTNRLRAAPARLSDNISLLNIS